MHESFVYIMSNRSKTLYVGMTNDIRRRVNEHKSKMIPGFTEKYNLTKLVYCEKYKDIWDAIAREKQIKGWKRAKKISLIETINPQWQDFGIGL